MVKRKRQPKDVAALLADLESTATFIRRSAIIELVDKGAPEAQAPLQGLLGDKEASIRACAAWALGELRLDVAVPALSHSLHDMDVDVRRAAVQSLASLACPGSLAALESASIDADRWVAEWARRGLARLSKGGKRPKSRSTAKPLAGAQAARPARRKGPAPA